MGEVVSISDSHAGRNGSWSKREPPEELYFVRHTLGLLESAAWRFRPLVARKILDRFELEYLRHRCRTNGRLIVTFDDLVAYGVRRQSIRRGLDQLIFLGLIEVTFQGYPARDGVRIPSQYRLTYVSNLGDPAVATNEWRGITSPAQAREALRKADLKKKPTE